MYIGKNVIVCIRQCAKNENKKISVPNINIKKIIYQNKSTKIRIKKILYPGRELIQYFCKCFKEICTSLKIYYNNEGWMSLFMF